MTIGRTIEQSVTGSTQAVRRGAVLWFTGLPASGKSTLSQAVRDLVRNAHRPVFILDGDVVRAGLCRDLGFTPSDRAENIRRIAEVARLFVEAGVIVLVAAIAPYRDGRAQARSLVREGEFVEIWCRCPVAVCEQRDPKGLYRKARAGQITELTGVSAPYEEPLGAELVIETDRVTVAAGVQTIMAYLGTHGIL